MSWISERLRNSTALSHGAEWIRQAADLMRLSRDRAAARDLSNRSAYIYLALFVPVLSSIVLSNWKWNALVGDTLLLTSSFEMLERFSSLFSNANANPLQALFDIFPSGLRRDAIPNIVGQALFGPGMHVNFFYICSGILLAYASAAMARAAGMRWGVAVLAGVLLPLLILPTFGVFPLSAHFFILWPITYYSAAGAILVTAIFWRIDERSWRRATVLTAVIILVLLHLSMIQVFFMTLLAPAMFAMGIAALIASRSRREFVTKVVCAVVICIALASAGIAHYLYALGLNTAKYVFYQELADFMLFSGPNWGVILDDIRYVVKNPFTYSFKGSANLDGVLVPLSQLGAIHLAFFGKSRDARIFGWTVLIWVLGTAAFIAFVHNFYYHTGFVYQGPDPRHLVHILIPYYAICLANLIFALTEQGVALLSRAWPGLRSASKYVAHVLVVLVLAGPIAFLATNAVLGAIAPSMTLGTQIFLTYLPSFTSFRPTPIVEYLEPKVGIAIDRPFRGSVLSMPTEYHKDVKPYAAWRRETTFAYARAYMANDLGAFGLRHFNIPTFDQMTHNITPQFYLTVRELLTRPDIDAYDRHFTLVTRPNERIMALLGLRYLIADYELPIGTERFSMPLPEDARMVLEKQELLKSPVRIFELPHPNLGNYSPTNVMLAKSAKAAIVAMASPAFDGRQTVLTDDPAIGGDLVAATDAVMTVRMGGVALRASSTGQSVLVLPVQYSHCWQIESGSGATLFRANLMQLGVRFSGALQVELRQIFGPFWQSACRIADAADVKRLRMVDALGVEAELHKIPGDGINLIPQPGALHEAIASTSIASIERVRAQDSPISEFKITAVGKRSEHYSVLSVGKLTPGSAYTLSMQVRANTARAMALQINDGTNGAFGEYLLATRNAWVHQLGQGEKRSATIREIDGEWLQVTLTSTVMAESAKIFIHVRDKGNSGHFKARGESVTIRAVKLEQGETATPY